MKHQMRSASHCLNVLPQCPLALAHTQQHAHWYACIDKAHTHTHRYWLVWREWSVLKFIKRKKESPPGCWYPSGMLKSSKNQSLSHQTLFCLVVTGPAWDCALGARGALKAKNKNTSSFPSPCSYVYSSSVHWHFGQRWFEPQQITNKNKSEWENRGIFRSLQLCSRQGIRGGNNRRQQGNAETYLSTELHF